MQTKRGAGTESRFWVLERRAAPIDKGEQSILRSTIWVAMRDGVRLCATLVRPADAPLAPGIVIANGYGAEADSYLEAEVNLLVPRGYLMLCANMRGIPPSEGNTGLYESFGNDVFDLIEWLAHQPGCNGCIGMVGGSLLGLVQYLGAKQAPPSLRALVPDDAGSDNYWYLWYPGGMNLGPGRAARRLVSGAENEYPLALAHRNYDQFWRERTVQRDDLEEIARRGIAVLLTSGWNSYLLGSTKSYEWLRGAESGAGMKMIIGPWGHGSFLAPEPPVIDPSILPFKGFEYCVMWLDRWLKGVRNGVDEEPPVLLYVEGPNEWRFEQDWPIPDERRVRMYLRAVISGTSEAQNDGSLSSEAPEEDGSFVYEYSPEGPYNLAAVTALSRPHVDKAFYERHGLVWTSRTLTAPTEITGYTRLLLWCAISAADTDFVAEITDVSAGDGPGRFRSMQVTRGYLNAMRFFSRSDPRPLVPGKVYCFTIELYPTCYVFAKGHRIRLTLQGTAIDPLASADQAVQQGPGLHSQPSRIAVLQDKNCRSFLELPIIGSGGLA